MPRATKGTVGVFASNGRLQARWTWRGKRYYLSLGVTDTPKNRKLAAGKVAQIQRDLDYGEFTGDVSRYQPQAVTPKITPDIPGLVELWGKYTEFRRPSLSPNTLLKTYGMVAGALSLCPYGLDNPVAVRDWLGRNYPPGTAKRILVQLNACGKWAVGSGLIESNPFSGMAGTIAIPKGEKSGDDDIDPFTPDERAAMIAGFEQSPYYRPYAPLVQFLFLTGCRPGEALALEWIHIIDGFIHFQQSSVIARANTVKAGLKTQSSRKFPINRQLQELLDSIPKVNKLVFPSPEGRVIGWGNFNRRAWTTVLGDAGVRHRKPYNCRHTFITSALQAGLSVQDVAKLVGNSPGVIYKHYAGASRELSVPEFE